MKSKIAEVKECHEGENQKLILCRQKKNSDFQVLISLNDYRGFVFSMRVNERKKMDLCEKLSELYTNISDV